MDWQNEISEIGHPFDAARDEWSEDRATIVDEPFLLQVRKLDAAPADGVEDLETVRGQLHATVDRLVDHAIESVGELRALVETTERQKEALSAQLDCVVAHSNALVMATAPRRDDDTLIEFPLAIGDRPRRAQARVAAERRRRLSVV